MKPARLIFLLFVVTFFVSTFSSCRKSIDADNNIVNNAPNNTIVATIDNASYSWKASGTSSTISGITAITIEGSDTTNDGKGVRLLLTNITKPGTYNVGILASNGTSLTDVTITLKNMISGNTTWYASSSTPGAEYAGKFTVQSIGPDSLKATFNATLAKESGSANLPPSVTITGSVNVFLQKQ